MPIGLTGRALLVMNPEAKKELKIKQDQVKAIRAALQGPAQAGA